MLQIGNEDWDLNRNLNWSGIAKSNHNEVDHIDDEGSGDHHSFSGPKTSALRQYDMNFYQMTNLRIIKPDKSDMNSTVAAPLPEGKNASENKLTRQYEGKDKPQSKVFSQVILNENKFFISLEGWKVFSPSLGNIQCQNSITTRKVKNQFLSPLLFIFANRIF